MEKYLSFDVGGTNVKYALINEEGHILEKNRVKTNTQNLNAFMNAMYAEIDKYQGEFNGIAVCTPGKIDVKNIMFQLLLKMMAKQQLYQSNG